MKVLFFAQAADAAGVREYACPLETAEAAAFWEHLLLVFPALAPLKHSIRLARNGRYAPEGERFCHGDEIALIPPVSGG